MPTFSKSERLSGKSKIDSLFSKGVKSFLFPFKIHVLDIDQSDEPCKVLIVVSKKISKSAVVRNRIKRQIKEAYRLEKEALRAQLLSKNNHIHLALVYIGKQNEGFDFLQEKIKLILSRLSKDCD
jgi:ribonuclease P protein component